MRPFKSGIGMMTAGTQVPVVPCHLEGTFEAFPPESYLPRFHKVTVRIGAPRTFEHLDNRRPGWDEVSRLLEKDIKTLAGVQPLPESPLATADPLHNPSPTTSTRN